MKSADANGLPRLVAQVWLEATGHGRFTPVLGRGVVLIPVPGSAPARRSYWVGERLARCLLEVGLATDVWPILRRRHAVRKSAVAAAGERPSVLEHYASFSIEQAAWAASGVARGGFSDGLAGNHLRVTLVDDVITRGRTLLAAGARAREAFPTAEIRAFALLRTLGRGDELHRILDPCDGEVRWERGDARRRP